MVGPHRPPAQAVQRGGQALGARRRPGAAAGRAGARRRPADHVRRRHRRRPRSSTSTPWSPRDADRDRRRPAGPGAGVPTSRRGWSPCWRRSAARSCRPATALAVTPPTWRPDLADPADLVEEVVRLDGYDKVPSVLPLAPPGRGLTATQRRRRSVAGRWPRPATSRCCPTRSSAPPTLDALGLPADDPRRDAVAAGQPAVGRGAVAAHDAAAAAAGDAAPQPRPGRTATWRCTRSGWCSARGPAPAAAAASMGVDDRPSGPSSPPPTRWCPSSRGTSPWCWPARSSRPAGGARAGRPAGPTRCEAGARSCSPPRAYPPSG